MRRFLLAAQRLTRALILVCGALVLTGAPAAVDLPRLMSFAQERYGARGAELVRQWSRLPEEVRGRSERDLLDAVNDFVNRRVLFQEDEVTWGRADYWATPLESLGMGRGDCEDYAIAKYTTLRHLGVANDKLRLVYVRARVGAAGSAHSLAHMVLAYFATVDAEPLILDNLISSVRPASARQDLLPVFSFNSDGLWVGVGGSSRGDATARLSLWRDVLERMRREGWTLTPDAPAAATPNTITP